MECKAVRIIDILISINLAVLFFLLCEPPGAVAFAGDIIVVLLISAILFLGES